MLKKTITYEDFNGEVVVEDFYFHLSKAELVELEMSHKDGLAESLKRIIAAEDGKAIIAEFKGIILGSYGKRSDDGRFFKKTQEIRDEFESSEAYSSLFMELVTNTDAAIEFINGIVPSGLAEEAAKVAAEANTKAPEVSPHSLAAVPVPVPEAEIISREEVAAMNPEQLEELGNRITAGEVKLGE